MTCRICGNSTGGTFSAREMVLGTREAFSYTECTSCGTVQIVAIPENLGDYYPNDYYSLQALDASSPHGKRKAKLLVQRDLQQLGVKSSLMGKLMQRFKPASFDSMYLAYAFVYQQLISKHNPTIHDAGCGNGFFLKYFHDLGFNGLSGSDPFLDKDFSYDNYRVVKKALDEVEGTYDVLLLNHVIEHVTDPVAYLKTVHVKLNSGGACLIRTPMSGSIGREHYGVNWVGMEPPRHLHVFDANYFPQLAAQLGFDCYAVRYDAIGWHYEASEAYSRDISLKEMNAHTPFTTIELETFAQRAREANTAKRGDTVAYYLKKS